MFVNTNLYMDIYGFIFMRGLKTGYRAQNSNKDVADTFIRIHIYLRNLVLMFIV